LVVEIIKKNLKKPESENRLAQGTVSHSNNIPVATYMDHLKHLIQRDQGASRVGPDDGVTELIDTNGSVLRSGGVVVVPGDVGQLRVVGGARGLGGIPRY
jgi:hypothetical protein